MGTFPVRYAHTESNIPGKTGWETVQTHLNAVADAAAKFASKYGMEDAARLAGLFHDAGKMSDTFAKRLQGSSIKVDHSSMGAWILLKNLKAVSAALAIAGHHIGIPSMLNESLQRLDPVWLDKNNEVKPTTTDVTAVLAELANIGVTLPAKKNHTEHLLGNVTTMLDIRMLFSALVDADFLETEAHYRGHREPSAKLDVDLCLDRLKRYVAGKVADHKGNTSDNVMDFRARLLEDCILQAKQEPGVFTLTAPTGSGKTLSMLRFALEHAKHWKKFDRIIFGIPYLTIIEQTCKTYRGVFDDELSILEDHCLTRGTKTGNSTESERAKWAAENWDAPVIVTTNVQLLESLFSNWPRPCRKLHNIANSIILLDEVQTLKLALARPTLQALAHLVNRYNCTIVLSTATQPAFTEFDKHIRKEVYDGQELRWRPYEIVRDIPALFNQARRVTIDMSAWNKPVGWDELSPKIAVENQALVVVNLKRHALALMAQLKLDGVQDIYHLSTNMCPDHRSKVLKEITHRLEKGFPVRLISTQCIEAGVDIDFPCVFRAFAPLDSLAQAAGRCNRKGNLPRDKAFFRVFLPIKDGPSLYPGAAYAQAADVLENLLLARGTDWLDFERQECFTDYYKRLYAINPVDRFSKDFLKALEARHFPEVSSNYFLIDQDAVNVLVCYTQNQFVKRLEEAKKSGITKEWVHSARPKTVNMFKSKLANPKNLWSRLLHPIPLPPGAEVVEDWFYLDAQYYDSALLGVTELDDEDVNLKG